MFGCATSTPDESSPRVYVRVLIAKHRLKLLTPEEVLEEVRLLLEDLMKLLTPIGVLDETADSL
jgi:hypothetical protein